MVGVSHEKYGTLKLDRHHLLEDVFGPTISARNLLALFIDQEMLTLSKSVLTVNWFYSKVCKDMQAGLEMPEQEVFSFNSLSSAGFHILKYCLEKHKIMSTYGKSGVFYNCSKVNYFPPLKKTLKFLP